MTNIKYAWEVQGTMKSIAEGARDAGHNVFLYDKSKMKELPSLIKKHGPDQIWLASSNLKMLSEVKSNLKIPVVGFGFSDPYYFDETRLNSYDIYVSNHKDTYLKYKNRMPTIYNPTACDFKFHKNMGLNKDLITIIGTTHHPRFKDPLMRLNILKTLRNDGFAIHAYGGGWLKYEKHQHNHAAIDGQNFLKIINKSLIGLDIQEPYSPLAHRMLEYGACGVPIITRNRPEINEVLEIDKEVLVYEDCSDLKDKLIYYLANKDKLAEIGRNAHERCKKSNNITHRIDHLFKELHKYA